jgi:hypothetical protein
VDWQDSDATANIAHPVERHDRAAHRLRGLSPSRAHVVGEISSGCSKYLAVTLVARRIRALVTR